PRVAALEAEAKQRAGWARAKTLDADGRAAEALVEAKRAAAEGPDNAELAAWIARTSSSLEAATTLAERKRRFAEASARADAEPDPASALVLWEAALQLADTELDRLHAGERIRALTRQMQDSDRARLYDAAIQEGDAAVAAQDFDRAEKRFRDALALRDGDAVATARLKDLAVQRARRDLADATARLESARNAKDWPGLQRAAEQILAVRPEDPGALTALAEAKQRQFSITPVEKGNRVEVVLDAANGVKLEFVTLKPVQITIFDGAGVSKRVKITKEFAIMTTEVTQEQWNSILGGNRSHFPGARHPVDSVTWYDVQDFLWKLNERLDGWTAALPTDAQWQYACRGGGKGEKYGFGDDETMLGEHAWMSENSQGMAHDVGLKKPNGLGLFDMHGNAWEWCWDAYVELGEIRETTDPAESVWGKDRLLHGGGSNASPADCRTAFRTRNQPHGVLWEYGFRPILVKGEDPAPHVLKQSFDLGRGVSITFRRVRAGTSPIGAGDERHMVTLTKDFWVQTTETTQAQWEAVMGKREFASRGADKPVESVSWDDAVEFAKKLSSRCRIRAGLPTEAEWEVACRGMTDMTWSIGDGAARVDEIAWTVVNAKGSQPVGRLRPNLLGLYDMSGNVWEWVADWHEPWTADPVTDPVGPRTGTERIIRGGCFTDNRELAASGYRMKASPGARQLNIGFRVVLR
ncbi:MAG: SUMF1/EgtB/PvdO family nonheme iron enzyme, partial [Candidatus Brocadiae bacterium]|nr:SUMF1/EgtB/PvdO family nonheme iron enzyme [Candidatus Brocadiia bacterium]